MSAGTPPEWDDVADLWRSETTYIAVEEVQRRAHRNRLRLITLLLAELISSAIGIATAAWLVVAIPMPYLGLGFGFGIAIFTAVVLRWQWSAIQSTGEHALKTLETAVNREEQVREFLRVGRALVLAALFAVTVATSAELREFQGRSSSDLLPLIASGVYLIAVLLCCAWIDRSAQRRAAVYRRLHEQLGGFTETEAIDRGLER